VTVACGVLVEIVLMILFGGIEVLEGKFLYGQWLLVVFLFFGKHLFDNRQVLWVGVVDACAR
jgi:hypothetical protein